MLGRSRRQGGEMRKFWSALLLSGLAFGWTARAHAQSQSQSQGQSQEQKPSLNAPAQQGQAGQANPPGQTAPPAHQITPDENKAYLGVQNELDPDRQLQLVEGFAKKYPDSPYLSDVYFFGAYASEQKLDQKGGTDPELIHQSIDYGARSLKANPNNLRTLLAMAGLLPKPQALRGSDADKENQLNDAEADGTKALQGIANLTPRANQTPEQVSQLKAELAGQAHASLGMVHLQRAMMGLAGPDPQELAKAETEYKAAVTDAKQPDPESYFRLGEIYRSENKIDDAIEAFSKASQSAQGSALQSFADKQVQDLKARKNQSSPPAKP
jgi:tetratricopeptide (TPR) repeat protein